MKREKDTAYYADLLLEVARNEYDDIDGLELKLQADIDYYGDNLKQEVESANYYNTGRCTVDEYEYARYLIENNLLDD